MQLFALGRVTGQACTDVISNERGRESHGGHADPGEERTQTFIDNVKGWIPPVFRRADQYQEQEQ